MRWRSGRRAGVLDLSVGQRLSLGFAIATLLLSTLVAASLVGLARINEAVSWQVGDIGRNERAACALKEAMYRHATAVSDYLIAPGPEAIASYRAALAGLRRSEQRVRELDRGEDQTSADLHRRLESYILAAERLVRAREPGGGLTKVAGSEQVLRRQRAALITRTRAYHDRFHGQMKQSRAFIQQTVAELRRGLLLIAASVLTALLVTAVLITRAVRRPAQELVRAVQSLAAGVYRDPRQALDPPSGAPRDEMRILSHAFHQLAHRLQRRDLRLEADAAVSAALASSLELETLAQAVLVELTRFAKAEVGAVYHLDGGRGLRAIARHGFELETEEAAGYLEFVRGAIEAGQELPLTRPPPAGPGEPPAGLEVTLTAAPIRVRDQTLGAVLLGRGAPLAPDCVSFVAASTRQLGITFENALAHRQILRLADDLRRQTEELKAAHRNKDEFLAVLGHELRNPLAAITYANHVLEADRRRENAGRMHRIIARQSERLSRIFEDLQDISRIDRGQLVLSKQRVDLAEIVRRSVEDISPAFELAAISLSVHLEDRPFTVEADPIRLEQVITNILHNAAKHVSAGGCVWIAVCQQDGEIRLSVRDSGVGIPAEHLPRIFDLFVSFSGAPGHGMGVGLALVKKVIELSGGSVRARSDGPGHGTEILITLPALAGGPPGPDEPGPDESAPVHDCRSEKRLSVLIVEDQTDVAETLATMLTLRGHAARLARDGAEAIDIALSTKPDVVLLDIGLPGMDGYQVMRRLRPQLPGTRFVALTGHGPERKLEWEVGFDRFLIKPVAMAVLEDALAGRG